MNTSPEGIALVQHYESCKLKAYKCPAGVWTVGWGHTGPDVKPGTVISQTRADELLREDLRAFETEVAKLVKVSLNQRQFDALVSFAFNVGANALKNSTLLRLLNAQDYTGAANQFLRWNKGGGQVLLGLTRRRTAERALFMGQYVEAALRASDMVR